MKPVYIINGFLESGKTEFISFTLDQPYFQVRGKTLLILCEEGEEEYDEALLRRTRTELELIGEEEAYDYRRLYLPYVFYQYEVAFGGNAQKVGDDHF